MFGNLIYSGEVFTIKGLSFSKASGTMALIVKEGRKIFIPYNI